MGRPRNLADMAETYRIASAALIREIAGYSPEHRQRAIKDAIDSPLAAALFLAGMERHELIAQARALLADHVSRQVDLEAAIARGRQGA